MYNLKNIIDKEFNSNLNEYHEIPWVIINSYFKNNHLERLVRHQIESYNNFVTYELPRTIEMFNPVTIHSEHDYVAELDKYKLEIFIVFLQLFIA